MAFSRPGLTPPLRVRDMIFEQPLKQTERCPNSKLSKKNGQRRQELMKYIIIYNYIIKASIECAHQGKHDIMKCWCPIHFYLFSHRKNYIIFLRFRNGWQEIVRKIDHFIARYQKNGIYHIRGGSSSIFRLSLKNCSYEN